MVRGFPQKGDILLTTEAPMGMVAKLDRDDVAIAQRLLTLRGKEGVLDNDYLLYLLQSPYGQGLLKERETGTTVTGIKQAEFRKIMVKLPDITIQKKIGSILSAIDQKMTLQGSILRCSSSPRIKPSSPNHDFLVSVSYYQSISMNFWVRGSITWSRM